MSILKSATLALAAAAMGMASISSASAYERYLTVYNEGPCPIYSVQISHVDRNDWGPDLLGQYVIPSGNYETVEPWLTQGYCRFDVLVTFENGNEVVFWDMNLCDGGEVATDGYRSWSA